jgi:hypothetical protein
MLGWRINPVTLVLHPSCSVQSAFINACAANGTFRNCRDSMELRAIVELRSWAGACCERRVYNIRDTRGPMVASTGGNSLANQQLKGSTHMRMQRINHVGMKAAFVALISAATGSFCFAQQDNQDRVQQPVLTVSAGQAGFIRLPDLRPTQQRYALTGERDSSEAARAWQRQAGPMLRVGNTAIVLPQSR